MEWLGRAHIDFTHNAEPLKLSLKDGTQTDLLQLAEQATPPCNLNPLYFNGHLQTAVAGTSRDAPKLFYKRHIFQSIEANIPGQFTVDWAVAPNNAPQDSTLPPRTSYWTPEEFAGLTSTDSKPTLVVMHGLSGGSHEAYLRHTIAPLVDSGKWEVIVINARGCAWSEITTGVFYNARATWDVRQLVKWLSQQYPNRPLFGVGFSLGANILTNYIGEEGEACVLKAAVLCSNPFNLEVANNALRRTWIGREVYMKTMGNSMKKLVYRHREAVKKYTNFDYDKIMQITYLDEFDAEIQPKAWGYPTASAYYRDASSTDSVLSIRIPVLAVHARDDPIAADEAMPYPEIAANPYTVMLATSLGGHLGWFEVGGSRWFSKPVCNFFNRMAFDVDLDAIPKSDLLPKHKREYTYNAMNRQWAHN
ncbi:hypothetical protein TD95_002183 [Thielaviopsis punctulata]|uniref:alcohol O-acetyltransferase n=1 Tax=Thielaviopsis punctulata TaxID=72032 RepID=A0A0F4ZFN8_9PEZI|nr:hypothetical protein TD95_002183 [Thielaviopsis punctulata]